MKLHQSYTMQPPLDKHVRLRGKRQGAGKTHPAFKSRMKTFIHWSLAIHKEPTWPGYGFVKWGDHARFSWTLRLGRWEVQWWQCEL